MTLSACCYALGYLSGLAAFAWMARRRNLATAGIMAVMGAGLLGGLVGANLTQWAYGHLFGGGEAGKTVLGGIAGGYLCILLMKRHLGIRRPTGDLFAVAVSAGEAVGRWGCFFGGCCYGKACVAPWAVWQHGAWRHPSQLYLSASNALILVALWRFDKTRPPENGLFYLQGVLYCVARFLVEFFREGPPPVWGLTGAQWACCAGAVFFGVRLARLLRPARPGGCAAREVRPMSVPIFPCANCGAPWLPGVAVCPHCGAAGLGLPSWPPAPLGFVPPAPLPDAGLVTGKERGDVLFARGGACEMSCRCCAIPTPSGGASSGSWSSPSWTRTPTTKSASSSAARRS